MRNIPPPGSGNGAGRVARSGSALPGDLVWGTAVAAMAAFLLVPAGRDSFVAVTTAHPYIVAFGKFLVLATMGELLARRIVAGGWSAPAGLPWRAAVWGGLGVVIVLVFEIFGSGVRSAMDKGLLPGGDSPALFAFFVSASMNLAFAPAMMLVHRCSDTLIDLKAERPGAAVGVADIVARIDWNSFVGFVLFRTIPLFWIPAHTITFLLPPGFRVLAAAVLSIALGAILAFAKRSGR